MKHNLIDIVADAQTRNLKLVANVIVWCKDDNQTFFLLLTRSHNNSYAGSEEPPGGKIDAHETVQEGAKREVLEETGIELAAELEFLIWGDVLSKEKVSRHFVFHAQITSKQLITLDPQEHSDYRWISLQELETSKMRTTLIEVIKQFKTIFES